MPEVRGGEGREPATEEQNRGEAGNRDHRRVFRDKEHGELEAGVLGVETGNELGFGFGKIKWRTIRFCDCRCEEADKADNLRPKKSFMPPRKNVPAEDSYSVLRVFLCFDNVLQAESICHEEHADNGHGESKFVTDHLCGAAQAAEKGIF